MFLFDHAANAMAAVLVLPRRNTLAIDQINPTGDPMGVLVRGIVVGGTEPLILVEFGFDEVIDLLFVFGFVVSSQEFGFAGGDDESGEALGSAIDQKRITEVMGRRILVAIGINEVIDGAWNLRIEILTQAKLTGNGIGIGAKGV
jgi:hypothetical protein